MELSIKIVDHPVHNNKNKKITTLDKEHQIRIFTLYLTKSSIFLNTN